VEVRHALENSWTFWYMNMMDIHTNKLPWKEAMKEIVTISTVEDFWSCYERIRRPSQVQQGSDYYFFKKGITPEWEAEANVNGGKWQIQLQQADENLDNSWENILLGMIGEAIDDEQVLVCGAVMSKRKSGNKIALWIKKRDAVSKNLTEEKIRQIWGPNIKLDWQDHPKPAGH